MENYKYYYLNQLQHIVYCYQSKYLNFCNANQKESLIYSFNYLLAFILQPVEYAVRPFMLTVPNHTCRASMSEPSPHNIRYAQSTSHYYIIFIQLIYMYILLSSSNIILSKVFHDVTRK